MKPDELTNGTKPVLKKQSGERKEERKRQRMNDGNNDEFSAAKKTGRGGTKDTCLLSERTCVACTLYVGLCTNNKGQGGRENSAENK